VWRADGHQPMTWIVGPHTDGVKRSIAALAPAVSRFGKSRTSPIG
jgi:hypothetical protein